MVGYMTNRIIWRSGWNGSIGSGSDESHIDMATTLEIEECCSWMRVLRHRLYDGQLYDG